LQACILSDAVQYLRISIFIGLELINIMVYLVYISLSSAEALVEASPDDGFHSFLTGLAGAKLTGEI
jgi:hypothetical protein